MSNYKSTFHFVIQSEAKNLKSASRCIQILPPYGRLDDRMFRKFNSDTASFFYMYAGSTSKGSPYKYIIYKKKNQPIENQ